MSEQVDDKRAFHLEEFGHLSEAFAARADEARDVLKYAVLSSAAIITWLTASDHQTPTNFRSLAWWLPFIICAFAWARNSGIALQMKMIEKYLLSVENAYGEAKLGYRKFYMNEIEIRKKGNWFIRLTNVNLFFGVLVCGCAVIGFSHN